MNLSEEKLLAQILVEQGKCHEKLENLDKWIRDVDPRVRKVENDVATAKGMWALFSIAGGAIVTGVIAIFKKGV